MASVLPPNPLPLSSVPPAAGSSGSRAAEQRRFVTRLMLRFGVPAADAEDAAHEVFLISCRRRVDLAGSEDRWGWLYLTARYVSLNQRRSVRRESVRRCGPREELERASADAALAPDEQLAAQQLCQL